MCINNFKGLSAVVAPYVIENKDILISNNISSVEVETIGLFTYYIVSYSNISDKDLNKLMYKIKKEKNLNSILFSDKIIVKFLFPKHTSFITSIAAYNDKSLFTESVISDNISFWKEYAYIVL